MNLALLLVPFVVFGLFPLATQLVAIVLHRTERLARLKARWAWPRRYFPLFLCFDLFAQNQARKTVAFQFGYNLKKGGVLVETGRVPDASEVRSFLDGETFENPAVVASVASFIVNVIETSHEFDAFELTLLTKDRSPLPDAVTGWFRHDEFERAPLREQVVLTYSVDA